MAKKKRITALDGGEGDEYPPSEPQKGGDRPRRRKDPSLMGKSRLLRDLPERKGGNQVSRLYLTEERRSDLI